MKATQLFSGFPAALAMILCIFLSLNSNAENFEVQLNGSLFSGGYNVSCYGSSNGSINAVVIGGTAPFTYVWSNGATSKNISNLGAATYTVTVTSSLGSQVTASFEIKQPNQLTMALLPSDYGGYNISSTGGNDGEVHAEINGGVPPYTYIWSNGGIESGINDLTSGTYSLTVYDMTNCTISSSIYLTEPSALHIVSMISPVHHGYQISCSDGSDGAVNLTVAGGVPPYAFNWSNGNFSEDIADLQRGDYSVIVTDANGAIAESSITLTQPVPLSSVLQSPDYPNGYPVSCYGCNNASISSNTSGGIAPYSYSWSSGQTTSNIGSVGAGNYNLTVTDANGCTAEGSITINSPERDDWTMTGNTGSNPLTNFIGTSDNKDLVFKTSSSERLRIKGTGNVEFTSLLKVDTASSDSVRSVFVDQNGLLRIGPGGPNPPIACSRITDNWYTDYCHNANDVFNYPLSGRVGIGISSPTEKLHLTGGNVYISQEGGGLIIDEGSNKRVGFMKYPGRPAGIWRNSDQPFEIGHTDDITAATSLITDFIIDNNGKVGIGTNPPTTSNYMLFVEGGISTRDILVKSGDWPDYVFSDDYSLLTIPQLKEFITVNKHLPGIPSASEIKNQNGVELGNMQLKLLQKIEEQSLYIINLQMQIDQLTARLNNPAK